MAFMDSYFVVGCDADGLTFDGPLERSVLEERIKTGYYGSQRTSFRTTTPKPDGASLQMDENELFIIRGHVVVPTPKETVTRWELP